VIPRLPAAIVLAGALLLQGCAASASELDDRPGDGVTVILARAGWSTGYFQAEVYANLLRRLGYDVTPPAEYELSVATFYDQAARGSVDLWANGWFPGDQRQLDRSLEDVGTIGEHVEPVGHEVPAGALQGILIDADTAWQSDVTSLGAIAADRELAARFDIDGDGRADVLGCQDEWECADQLDALLAPYRGRIEQQRGDYTASVQLALQRIDAGESTLLYTWTPNYTPALLTPGRLTLWLDVEPGPGASDEVYAAPLGTCTADPCRLGFQPSDIRVVANSDFLAANPAARILLSLVQIPLEDINAQNLELERSGVTDDAVAAAEAWINAHKGLVLDWLVEARRAADAAR
jgi:glycine betaine/proline transport system substrate-binding protein